MRRALQERGAGRNGPESIPLVGTVGCDVMPGCLGDPHLSAMECVLKGDLAGLTSVLADVAPVEDGKDGEAGGAEYPLPLDHWVNLPTGKQGQYKSLLHAAIELGREDMVRLLLAAGARADLHNDDLGLSPVHVAAREGKLAILTILLGNPGNKAEVSAMMRNGRTALHLAAEAGRQDMVEFLLSQAETNVDGEDLMGRQTPLLLAVKGGHTGSARLLLEYGASVLRVVDGRTIQVIRISKCADFKRAMDKHHHAQEIMKEKMPGLDPNTVSVKAKPKENSEQDLLYSANRLLDKGQRALQKGQSNVQNLVFFKTIIQSVATSTPPVLDTFNGGGMTLVQKAASYGLPDFLACLLDHRASPCAVLKDNTDAPVLLAAYGGHADVLQILLEHKGNVKNGAPAVDLTVSDPHTGETALHMVLQMPQRSAGPAREQGYKESLDLLLNSSLLESELERCINKRDILGNTPLHYATQAWPQAAVRLLLERGANIGLKNKMDETPIERIPPETMEDFLDNFCLTSKNEIHQKDFQLNFKYHFLAPPVDHPQYSEADPEGQEKVKEAALPETESLWYMAQSKEHRHLLKHPVITSFLWMKWQRIRKLFNRNLRLYLLFVTTLTWYIFERFGGVSFRSKPEPSPDGSSAEAQLFCSSSLLGKDPSVGFWYGAFLLQALFQLLSLARDWRKDIKESDCKVALQVFLTSWLEYFIIAAIVLLLIMRAAAMPVILTILLALVAFREGLQMMVSLKRYIFGSENWLELITLGLVASLLFTPDDSLSADCNTERYLAAVALVLAWATLITLVGRHPKLSRYNIYVTMFYKILETFVTFLVWYSFFLIAFALGFYIMLHKDVKSVGAPGDVEGGGGGEEDYKFFDNPWLSIVKTSTMFVGEIEFSDIPISTETSTWPIGYLYLLTFIFLIVVVLMNLLNGLAVSDTAVIQEKAEIVTYVIRVETIASFEAVLLGDPFNFLANWPAIKLLKDLPSMAFCKALHHFSLFRSVSHKITGATAILLFYTWLPNKTLNLTPNRGDSLCNCLAIESMGQEVIDSAKAVVVRKRQAQIALLDENKEDKVDKIEKQLLALGEKVEAILQRLK